MQPIPTAYLHFAARPYICGTIDAGRFRRHENPDRMRYDIETYGKDRVFFTSDTHFSHANIIRLCSRPFADIEEMNEVLIGNWNRVVPEDGVVFHLGDFSYGSQEDWGRILDRLNGEIHLILGNHDMQMAGRGVMERFAEVTLQKVIRIDGRDIILNHCPFLCYSGEQKGQWQLFGHVHSGPDSTGGFDIPRLEHLFRTQYDVGVDNNGFTPVSYEQIRQMMEG